jgi:hypothetical protein
MIFDIYDWACFYLLQIMFSTDGYAFPETFFLGE